MNYEKTIINGQSRTLFVISCCLLAVCMGCGPATPGPKNRASVSGTVTVNGEPLSSARMYFHSVEGSVTVPVSIYEKGEYRTDRAAIGKNLVTIDTSSIKFSNPSGYVPIPEKYSDKSTSGFSVDIQPGANDNVDFQLTK